MRDLVTEGHEVPAPRDIGDIPVEEEDQEIGRALIPVELPGKSVKISISIDEALLVRIDRAAEATGLTRSGFIAAAAEDRIRSSAAGRETYARKGVEELSGFAEDAAPYAAAPLGADERIRIIYPQIVGQDPHTGDVFVVNIDPRKQVMSGLHRKSPARKGSD